MPTPSFPVPFLTIIQIPQNQKPLAKYSKPACRTCTNLYPRSILLREAHFTDVGIPRFKEPQLQKCGKSQGFMSTHVCARSLSVGQSKGRRKVHADRSEDQKLCPPYSCTPLEYKNLRSKPGLPDHYGRYLSRKEKKVC